MKYAFQKSLGEERRDTGNLNLSLSLPTPRPSLFSSWYVEEAQLWPLNWGRERGFEGEKILEGMREWASCFLLAGKKANLEVSRDRKEMTSEYCVAWAAQHSPLRCIKGKRESTCTTMFSTRVIPLSAYVKRKIGLRVGLTASWQNRQNGVSYNLSFR